MGRLRIAFFWLPTHPWSACNRVGKGLDTKCAVTLYFRERKSEDDSGPGPYEDSMVRLVVALILLFPAVIWAGKEEGVMAEFRKVEEDIKNKEISPAVRKKTLEANLVRAMKLAI